MNVVYKMLKELGIEFYLSSVLNNRIIIDSVIDVNTLSVIREVAKKQRLTVFEQGEKVIIF